MRSAVQFGLIDSNLSLRYIPDMGSMFIPASCRACLCTLRWSCG